MEICPKCGLPIQACVCDEIIKSSQKIKITNEKKRYGKIVTVINGFNNSVKEKDIAKRLKSGLAGGGTFKEGTIELKGEHTKKAKEILVKLGFDEDSID